MALDGFMFDNLLLSPFLDRVAMSFASVHPHIFDVVILSVTFKGVLF